MALNQFAQSVMKGMVDLTVFNQIITVQHKTGESTALSSGDLVKLDPTANGSVPVVVAASADTDIPYGVAILNPMRQETEGGQYLEVAAVGSTIYVEVAGALNRGAEITYSSKGVFKAAVSGDVVIGKLIDEAVAGKLVIRAQIIEPKTLS